MQAMNAIKPFVKAHPVVSVLMLLSVLGTVAYAAAGVRYAAKGKKP